VTRSDGRPNPTRQRGISGHAPRNTQTGFLTDVSGRDNTKCVTSKRTSDGHRCVLACLLSQEQWLLSVSNDVQRSFAKNATQDQVLCAVPQDGQICTPVLDIGQQVFFWRSGNTLCFRCKAMGSTKLTLRVAKTLSFRKNWHCSTNRKPFAVAAPHRALRSSAGTINRRNCVRPRSRRSMGIGWAAQTLPNIQ